MSSLHRAGLHRPCLCASLASCCWLRAEVLLGFLLPWLRASIGLISGYAECMEKCRVVSCRVVSSRLVSCRVVLCRLVSSRVVTSGSLQRPAPHIRIPTMTHSPHRDPYSDSHPASGSLQRLTPRIRIPTTTRAPYQDPYDDLRSLCRLYI